MQCNEEKMKYIQGKTQAPPSNHAIGMANTKFPLQRSKMSRVEGFGEDISQLPLCANVFHLYISLLYTASQEVVSRMCFALP
jgi:hypothetical protein